MSSQRVNAPAECVFVHASTVCVCFRERAWVINEGSWMASAGHDSTTARKSFLLSPWTADSELAGIFCWLLKSHHKGAVIITPITASQQKARAVAIKKEIKAAINDISFPVYGGERPRLMVEMWTYMYLLHQQYVWCGNAIGCVDIWTLKNYLCSSECMERLLNVSINDHLHKEESG